MATPQEGRNVSRAGLLIALGFIFGDIGTSPLYVFKAIIGRDIVSTDLVYGSISCIFWTLLLITTYKYVYLALEADNRGEGGIFALYARIRRYRARWAIFPAMIGCATLLADGFLTPSISVSAAVEGLQGIPYFNDYFNSSVKSGLHFTTTGIVIIILCFIFIWQQFGAQLLAKYFGYIMFVWFSFIAYIGFVEIVKHPSVLYALNPLYAIKFVLHYKSHITGLSGFWLLGAIFLCTTGGEALYSDMGRCGKTNIRLMWLFVFPCLLLSYLGQGAWLLQYNGQLLPQSAQDIGIFYAMIPSTWLPYVVLLAVIVAIIVSEALIAGVFTMVNEAMKLRLWFNMKVHFPSHSSGQLYIPLVNWFLLAGCILTVWHFHTSDNMEEAYGLAIVVDMLMTTSLLLHFVHMKNQSLKRAIAVGLVFAGFEALFLVANLHKLSHGGWFTLLIAAVIFFGVFVFWYGQKIRQKHTNFIPTTKFKPVLKDLIGDETIPRLATNLVYLTTSNDEASLDSNIIYSIFRKQPKRADIYWFLHIVITDSPYTKKYKVHTIVPGKVFFIRLKFGFKVEHKVNKMFKEIVTRMQDNGEVDELSHYPSLRRYDIPADFTFILLNSRVSADDALLPFEQFIVRAYRILKRIAISPAEQFGLESGNYLIETVPINVAKPQEIIMTREDK